MCTPGISESIAVLVIFCELIISVEKSNILAFQSKGLGLEFSFGIFKHFLIGWFCIFNIKTIETPLGMVIQKLYPGGFKTSSVVLIEWVIHGHFLKVKQGFSVGIWWS